MWRVVCVRMVRAEKYVTEMNVSAAGMFHHMCMYITGIESLQSSVTEMCLCRNEYAVNTFSVILGISL